MHDIRRELKKHLIPRLRGLGFKGSFPHFRRLQGEQNQLLTFQFNKHGTGNFVIELAVAPRGNFTTYWGKEIPETKLKAHDLSKRLRLGANVGEDYWFTDDSGIHQLVEEILALLNTQGQQYFEEGA